MTIKTTWGAGAVLEKARKIEGLQYHHCSSRSGGMRIFSIDFACLQISPFETVTLYAASGHSPR